MTSGLHAIAELVTLRLLDSLAEGTLVCLFTAMALRLAPRQNAGTRFAVWFSALVAIAALPWIQGSSSSGFAGATHHAAITIPGSWAIYCFAAWGLLALWFSVGVLQALRRLIMLRRDCVVVDAAELDPLVRETLERHGVSRGIVLCTSEKVRVPTAIGLFQPMILIPSWIMRELSPTDLNNILLHELAHFRRWDDWTNLAQQLVKVIFFFHPAVWWIEKNIAIECEMACDDAVLAETQSPRAYAECLARLAEKTFLQRTVALAQAAIGKLRQTSARIAEILDANRPGPNSRSWGAGVSFVVVLALGCGALYSRTPDLIAFTTPENRSQSANVSSNSSPETAYRYSVPLVQAKFNPSTAPVNLHPARKKRNHARNLTLQPKAIVQQNQNLVHVTASKISAVPVTETLWVVVENPTTNPAVPQIYQIQMWRVTVLRTVISAPSRQVSRSEI